MPTAPSYYSSSPEIFPQSYSRSVVIVLLCAGVTTALIGTVHSYTTKPVFLLLTALVIAATLLEGAMAGIVSVVCTLLAFRYVAGPFDVPVAQRLFANLAVDLVFVTLITSLRLVGKAREKARLAAEARAAELEAALKELRGAEEALRISEKRYRSLFESIDEGFCLIEIIFDENGRAVDYRFLETNPSFEKQTGLTGVRGKTIRALAPQHEEHWFEIYGRIAMTGEPVRFQNRAEQLHRWYDVYGFRYGNPGDRQVAVLFNDISERKRTEEALIHSEKLAAMGRLAATIAHEVNNPLAGAMNAIYVASGDSAVSPQTRQMLALADQELGRAAHIVQRTLGFCRDGGARTPVALPKLIDEVLRMYARTLKDRNITVQCRYNCGPCREECDTCFLVNAGELRQVISNLLGNGMDAVGENGNLQIRVSRMTAPHNAGEMIHFTIADDGCGIRPENLKRIFEPFFTTKESVGTGLGLWVTQELVRKHNGTIRVRSGKGGTVFRISIPAAPATASVSAAGNSSSPKVTDIMPAAG
ncbi:MAG: two-component system sensor histidine kinase NtrB [Terriglobales bacterium]